MKFELVKEIEHYIKSLDECQMFEEVRVVSVEKFNRFDRYTVCVYRNQKILRFFHLIVKNGKIVNDANFEMQIRAISFTTSLLEELSSNYNDRPIDFNQGLKVLNRLSRAPKEITTSITGTRR